MKNFNRFVLIMIALNAFCFAQGTAKGDKAALDSIIEANPKSILSKYKTGVAPGCDGFSVEWDGVRRDTSGRIISLLFDNCEKFFTKGTGPYRYTEYRGTYDCEISTFPAELGNLSELKSLRTRQQPIRTLPPEIVELSNLEVLALTFGGIRALPAEICQLGNLKTLDIMCNNFNTPLPPEIGNLSNLRTILANDAGDIGPLPPEVGNLVQLKKLNIYGCRLTSLPDAIVNLTNLEELNVSRNYLTRDSLSETVIDWLDTNDPDWESTQETPVAVETEKISAKLKSKVKINNNSLVLSHSSSGLVKVEYYNFKGQLVASPITKRTNSGTVSFSFDQISATGVYIANITTEEGAIRHRFTVQR